MKFKYLNGSLIYQTQIEVMLVKLYQALKFQVFLLEKHMLWK
ncbi:hypothetical protein SAMN06265346_104185 [Flavobacterium hercynium]|nr:hypothetical protein SAMN06265346_104185 [Flavobacterium hercynium]